MASSDDKVRVNMTSGERTIPPLQPAVRRVLEKLRAGDLPEPNRRALLDALGHGDCVPREHRGCHWEHEAQRYAGNADYWRDRAERAERERDALREAIREHRRSFKEGNVASMVPTTSDTRLWTALSADADAEPDHVRSIERDGEAALTRDFYRCPNTGEWVYRWCDERMALRSDHVADAEPTPWETPEDVGRISVENMGKRWEPSRAEGVPPCDCIPVQEEGGDVHRPWCAKSRYKQRVADGGRPREADPPAVSGLGDDASVDGGGDDGRSRAAIATEAVEQAARSRMAEDRVRELEGLIRELIRSSGVHREYRQDREPMGYCENCGEPWPCPTYRARRDVRDRTDGA